jgi:amino acid permease
MLKKTKIVLNDNMKTETFGNKIGFLTGMIIFITIFYFVLSLKFEWISNYLSYYNTLYLAIATYTLYLIFHGVYKKCKK